MLVFLNMGDLRLRDFWILLPLTLKRLFVHALTKKTHKSKKSSSTVLYFCYCCNYHHCYYFCYYHLLPLLLLLQLLMAHGPCRSSSASPQVDDGHCQELTCRQPLLEEGPQLLKVGFKTLETPKNMVFVGRMFDGVLFFENQQKTRISRVCSI